MAKWLSMVSALLALPVAFAFPAPNGATIIKERSELLNSYDYVIVGGGTSGLAVANRLSENPNISVLVIEAGKLDPMQDDVLVPRLVNGAADIWSWPITSQPVSELNGRTHPVYVGKLVGGGSAINGMAFDRGAKGDYDAWQTLGNSGWTWNNLLPYFKKSESYSHPSPEIAAEYGIEYDPSAHGTSGPIKSSYPHLYPVNKVIFSAMRELGIPTPKDGANGNAIGTFWVPASLDKVNGTRSYARTAYYESAKARPNYHLLTEQQATKLVTAKSGKKFKITGVQYGKDATTPIQTVSARREVILAGGAIFTPRLLKLSGIGPKKQLQKLGITSVIDLPGVGENLQDHPAMFTGAMLTNGPIPGGSLDDLEDPAIGDAAWAEYRANKTGPITIAQGNALSFIPLRKLTDFITLAKIITKGFLQPARTYLRDVDATVAAGFALQKSVLLAMLASDNAAAVEIAGGIGGGAISIQKTFSRGFVDIPSKDPFALPIVDLRAFSNPLDFDVMIESFKFWRKISDTPTGKRIGQIDVFPGADVKTDAQIKDFIKNTAWPSFAHYSGTCIMLKRSLGGVVDADLKVYDTTNLRIVDASIQPLVPSTHIQSTVYAVAERAADIIKRAQ